jgi:hypothetical protein
MNFPLFEEIRPRADYSITARVAFPPNEVLGILSPSQTRVMPNDIGSSCIWAGPGHVWTPAYSSSASGSDFKLHDGLGHSSI